MMPNFIFLILLYPFSLFCSEGLVFYLKGELTIDNQRAEVNQKIHPGQILVTAKNSLAIIKLGPTTIKMNPETQLALGKNEEHSFNQEIELSYGQSIINLAKKNLRGDQGKNGSQLKITSKNVSLGVRGTTFFVSQKKEIEDLFMCVEEGLVEVQLQKATQSVLVKPGEGIRVQGNFNSPPRELPWTKNLNWNLNPEAGNLEDSISIESAYFDLLDFDYD